MKFEVSYGSEILLLSRPGFDMMCSAEIETGEGDPVPQDLPELRQISAARVDSEEETNIITPG